MTKRMLIDATHAEETRVAVVDDKNHRLLEFDYESKARKPLKGSIFLAKVTRVEPSLQAAFVNFGGNRHGFLPFSEIHPDYYRIPISDREALMAEQEAYLAAEEERRAAREREEEQRKADEDARRAQGETIEESAEEEDEDDYEDEDGFEELNADGPDNMAPPSDETDEDDNEAEQNTADDGIEAQDNHAPAEEIEDDETQESAAIEAAAPYAASHDVDEDEGDSVGNRAPREDGDEESENDVDGNRAGAETHQRMSSAEGAEEGGQNRRRNRHGRGRRGGRNGGGGGGRGRHAAHRSQRVEILGGTEYEDDGNSGEQRFRMNLRRQYKIQEVIKRGQIMLIQVSREERGNKGAAVTTYLSLPGRYGVLMPNSPRSGGVSRKIANYQDRARMRDMLKEMDVPKGMSVILRTAGVSRTKLEIKRDVEYLMRLWDDIRELTLKSSAPSMIYEEADLIKKAVRDLYTRDVEEILVSGDEGFKAAKKFMKMLIPSHMKKISEYTDEKTPLFHRYHVENQIAEMGETSAKLKSGGYLVINPTEALVSIDVNSGRATKERHIEETALNTNLEAAEEVARQLRLRDLGGLIVIDFIDMEDRRNNARVERKLKEALSQDRARIQMGRISSFGLLELSRQRLNPSLTEAQFEACKHCAGRGVVRNRESTSIMLIRALEHEGIKGRAGQVMVYVAAEVALYILNYKRAYLDDIERRYGFSVVIRTDETLGADGFRLEVTKPAEGGAQPQQGERRHERAVRNDDQDDDQDEALESGDESGDDQNEDRESRGDQNREGRGDGEGRRRRGRRGGRGRNRNRNRDDRPSEAGHENDGEEKEFSESGQNEDDYADEQPSFEQDSEDGDDRGNRSERSERGGRNNNRRRGGRNRRGGQNRDRNAGEASSGAADDGDEQPSFREEAPAERETQAAEKPAAAKPERQPRREIEVAMPKVEQQSRKPIASAEYETITEAPSQERKKGWWNRLVE